jgi:serine/threonine protein kinase
VFDCYRSAQHDNLCKFYGYFTLDGFEVCLVSENAKYTTLLQLIESNKSIDVNQIGRIALDIAKGLAYLQELYGSQQMINLKPHNVMVENCKRILLLLTFTD